MARTATKVVAKSSSPTVFSATQTARYCGRIDLTLEKRTVVAALGDEELVAQHRHYGGEKAKEKRRVASG